MGGQQDSATAVGELVHDVTQPPLCPVVEPPCGLVEQQDRRVGTELDGDHEREPLAFGQVPWVLARGDAGRDPLQQVGAAAGVGAALVVGTFALACNGVQIEQVAGLMRHEAYEPASSGRVESRRVEPTPQPDVRYGVPAGHDGHASSVATT